MKLHHAAILVSDLQRARRFYREVMDLQELPRPDLGYQGAWLDCDGQQLHLLALPDPDRDVPRPQHVGRDRHLAFAVDDLDALVRRLDRDGIDWTRSRSGRAAVFFRDPDGNGIEAIACAAP